MTIIDWGDDEETFIVVKFNHAWTPEDFVEAVEKIVEFAQQRNETVNVIVDLQRASILKGNIIALGRWGQRTARDHVDTVVVVTQSAFWQIISQMVARIYPNDVLSTIHFVNHADQAYAILEQQRDSAVAS
jgi:hypothetical protein